MTLNAAILSYLNHLREDRALAARTLTSYRQELRLFADALGPETRVCSLGREQVIAHLERTDSNGRFCSPATRNRKLTVLRGFFSFLTVRAHAKKNPTDGVRRARVPEDERPCLDRQGYWALLRAAERERLPWLRERDRILVKLLFHTGARVTEVVSITVEQLDLEAALLVDLRRKGGANQTIPLNSAAVTELQRWLMIRRQRQPKTDRLLIGRTGQSLGVRQVERRLKALGEQAGIPFPVTPHVLRHTYATELIHKGVNLEVVRRLMNHQSITTTSRYGHVGFEVLREAVERLVEERG